MPTYDYQCAACNHEFEVFQGINDELLVKCPACGKKKLKRLFGAGAGIIFKGSGFYQTDYRSEGYKKSAASDSKSASESKPAETKSDSSSTSSSSDKPAPGGKSDSGGGSKSKS